MSLLSVMTDIRCVQVLPPDGPVAHLKKDSSSPQSLAASPEK